MTINLKKLQSYARRRLGLYGQVEFVKVSSRASGILATSTNTLDMKHTISYSDAATLDTADVYHEMCRAKLDEYGFKSVENAALVALRDCSKNDPKYIMDANSAVVIVSEVYTSWLLFTYFPEESEERRQRIVQRFQSSDALTSLHTRMGFWGVAGITYYKIASEWSGKEFPSKFVESAISRATDGKAISEELSKIEAVLRELPRVDRVNEPLSDTMQLQILDAITSLFCAKTGLECE